MREIHEHKLSKRPHYRKYQPNRLMKALILIPLLSGCAILYPDPTVDNCGAWYGAEGDAAALNCPRDEDGQIIVNVRPWREVQRRCLGEGSQLEAWGCVVNEGGIHMPYAVPLAGSYVKGHERCHCLGKWGEAEGVRAKNKTWQKGR